MKEFIWEYRYILIIILAAAVYAIFNWQKVKTEAYKGMLQAKSLAKDAILHSGKEQEDWVVDTVWPLLPIPARVFLTREVFRAMVRKLYQTAKDYIDDGKLNGSVPRPKEE